MEAVAVNLTKDVNVDWAAPGDLLTYTVSIQEDGSPVSLWMTDTLPEEVSYVNHTCVGPGSCGYADGVVTWSATSIGWGATAVITFSAEISSETTVGEIVNTAEVTGTGDLITDSASTQILTGQPPSSQIRSPDRDTLITEDGSLTVSGIAWGEGVEPPYLVGDLDLSADRQGDRSYYLLWNSVVSATDYLLQEATQPDFSDQTSTIVGTTSKLLSKDSGEDGLYYYRVRASNPGVGNPSRWSNVVTVNVPWSAASSGSSLQAVSADVATNDVVTVQVRIDDGTWHNAAMSAASWGGWDWSYDWSLPEERMTQHTISTRASGEDGTWGPTDTITVTVDNKNYVQYLVMIYDRWPPIPYVTTLNDIDNPNEEDSYIVSWSYEDNDPDVPDPISYTLQEATDADFTNPTEYTVSGTQKEFIDKSAGTYYYRVRGHNTYGPGAWSDAKSTSVRSYTYHYEFNSPTKLVKPWPVRRTSYWQGDIKDITWTEEHDGDLFFVMNDKFDFAIASPMEVAPAPPYTIQTRVRVRDAANLVAYGVVFGANAGSPCPTYRDSGCFFHYYRLEVVWDGRLKAGFKRIYQHESEKGKGQGEELVGYKYVSGDSFGYHTWRFDVKTDGIDIYYDGELFGSTSNTDYINDPYFGVYVSANEYKPSIGQFDYFRVDPQ